MIDNKEKNFISAVIYLHNDQDQIEAFLASLINALKSNFQKYEIICVNDASIDSTIKKIKDFFEKDRSTVATVLNIGSYSGVEVAMAAGTDLAIGDFVFEFDSVVMDYPQDMVMELYRASLEGFDIVTAAPTENSNGYSQLFYKVFNKFSLLHRPLRTERLHLLSRRGINRVRAMNLSVPYRKAAYADSGLKTKTLLYKPKLQIKDKRKFDFVKFKLATDSLILFTDMAYQIALAISLGMILFCLGISVYALVIWTMNLPIAGWTSTILFLTASFAGVFLVLAFIIKYLSVLVDLVFRKQRCVFESIEKISNQ